MFLTILPPSTLAHRILTENVLTFVPVIVASRSRFPFSVRYRMPWAKLISLLAFAATRKYLGDTL